MTNYLFNVTFTRPDEQDATPYAIGYRVVAISQAAAETSLRRQLQHLTVLSVELFALLPIDDDDTVN